MRKHTLIIKAACIVLLCILLNTSCGERLTGKEDMCLERYAEEDIEANPKLKKIHAPIIVDKAENGYVTLIVTGINPFSYEAIEAIQNGKKLQDIQRSIDPSVDVLIETEEIIKKIPGVKAVAWTADKKVTSTSSAGYTSRSSAGGPRNSDACPKR